MKSKVIILAAALILFGAGGLAGQDPPSTPAGEGGDAFYVGSWGGARLQCRKEEQGPVRCGTPSPFQITFKTDGTGICRSQDFPAEFLYESSEEGKMVIMDLDKTSQWDLFAMTLEDDFLSFQSYIRLSGPEGGEGDEYIHYIYDMAGIEEEDLTAEP